MVHFYHSIITLPDVMSYDKVSLLTTLATKYTCADPESFVRGGPNLITFLFFFLMRE